jgi:AcrR family transcriptional regulator
MTTLTRKQREIQHRESQILDLARDMLLEHGYHGLSMDRIAESLEYSKGTIYQHFSCKEEILLALANEALDARVQLFRRAAAFRGRPRERMAAVGLAAELFARLYPHHLHVEQVVRLSSVWEKTSEKRRHLMRTCETQCMATLSGIVRDAVAVGDLALPASVEPEAVVFGLWSMNYGAQSIAASSDTLAEIGIADPHQSLRDNCNHLLDGFGWSPLTSELDYDACRTRICREVFPREAGFLGGRS